jgi:hypothetical protein
LPEVPSVESVAGLVRAAVDADPCLRECLARGLANYSEVARRLKPVLEARLGSEVSLDAIKTALIRYARRLAEGGESGLLQSKLLWLLASSSVELKSDVSVVVVKPAAYTRIAGRVAGLADGARLLLVLQSLAAVTLVADSEAYRQLEPLLEAGDVVEVWEGQAALIIVSPKDVVSVPGFIAYIAGLLASNNINIQQIESVYTDTITVLSPDDTVKAYQLITTAISLARQLLKAPA